MRYIFIIFLAVCWLDSTVASAQSQELPETLPSVVLALPGSPEIDSAIKKYQATLSESAPAVASAIYRDQQIREELLKIWHAYGYYGAEIDTEQQEDTLVYRAVPGPLYQFGKVSYDVEGPGASAIPEFDGAQIIAARIRQGKPAYASSVVDTQAQLQEKLAGQYCLFDYNVAHQAVVDHARNQVDVHFTVTVGRKAYFDAIRFFGAESFSKDYIRRLLPIEKGQCFRRQTLTEARLALQRTGHFATVNTQLPPAPAADGGVEVTFELKEAAARTVKAGANYSTDIGPGVSFEWEHRNLFSRGEEFNSELLLTPIQQLLEMQLEKPFFLRQDQKLRLGAALRQQDSDAFQTTGMTLTSQVERSLADDWKAATGLSYGFERVDNPLTTRNFALFSLPSYFSKDARDDLLNPKEGWTFKADFTPFLDTLNANTTFFKTRLSGSYYLSADWQGKPTLAVRAATGSITGVATDDVPATERFFTGGAGSVRGYAFQELGPLDNQNNPLGGRSFVESSVELRMRAGSDYGFAVFVDGGNTFDEPYPDFNGGLRFGAGIGLLYFTGFGPLRADIAVPLDRRNEVDDHFQLYFNIGQAF